MATASSTVAVLVIPVHTPAAPRIATSPASKIGFDESRRVAGRVRAVVEHRATNLYFLFHFGESHHRFFL